MSYTAFFVLSSVDLHLFQDDSAAHVSEETAGAAMAAPIAILLSLLKPQ